MQKGVQPAAIKMACSSAHLSTPTALRQHREQSIWPVPTSDSVIQWYRTVKVISDTVPLKWSVIQWSDSVIIQWYSDTQRYIILSQWYSDSQWYIILSSDYLNQFINPACDHQEITALVRDHQEITAPVRDHPSNRQRVCVTSLVDHVSTLVII